MKKFAWTALVILPVIVAGCGQQTKPAAPKAAVAAAPIPPCEEKPEQRKARVAGAQTVSMTSCARPAAEWATERPGLAELRPHLNP